MKFQPKRFVVEVKRGTSRASFASPDASADRFSGAEAALFGSGPKADAKREAPGLTKPEPPSGRILRSLVEPPPLVMEDAPQPNRRGRKPGSKNKPKPQSDAAGPMAEAEKPRRGRKPGSKNKPKPQGPTAFLPPSASSPENLAAVMRSYGFSDDSVIWTAPKAPTVEQVSAPTFPSAVPGVAALPDADEPPPGSMRPRTRLRDRSSILKRYVLNIEPRPGQPGAIRARRLTRAV